MTRKEQERLMASLESFKSLSPFAETKLALVLGGRRNERILERDATESVSAVVAPVKVIKTSNAKQKSKQRGSNLVSTDSSGGNIDENGQVFKETPRTSSAPTYVVLPKTTAKEKARFDTQLSNRYEQKTHQYKEEDKCISPPYNSFGGDYRGTLDEKNNTINSKTGPFLLNCGDEASPAFEISVENTYGSSTKCKSGENHKEGSGRLPTRFPLATVVKRERVTDDEILSPEFGRRVGAEGEMTLNQNRSCSSRQNCDITHGFELEDVVSRLSTGNNRDRHVKIEDENAYKLSEVEKDFHCVPQVSFKDSVEVLFSIEKQAPDSVNELTPYSQKHAGGGCKTDSFSQLNSTHKVDSRRSLLNSATAMEKAASSAGIITIPSTSRDEIPTVIHTLKLKKGKGRNTLACLQCHEPSCSYKARSRGELIQHMRKHTGERPIPCEWETCDKRFKDKSTYRVHYRSVHLRRKDYKCLVPGCGKKFGCAKSRNRHSTNFNLHENMRKGFV